MFFCDCLSSSIDFFRVFNLNSSLSFSYNSFLDYISLTSFKVWVFSNDDIIGLFTFVGKLTISLRTIFYDLVCWLNSFFCYFKLASILVKCSSILNISIRAFFDDFLFAFLKLWIVSVFCIMSKFCFLNDWLNTYPYYPIFFFSDSFLSNFWISNRFRILNLLSSCDFLFSNSTLFFYYLRSCL